MLEPQKFLHSLGLYPKVLLLYMQAWIFMFLCSSN